MLARLCCSKSHRKMKRPARAQGRATHRCSVCGSTKHRLETCEEPGAQKIRELHKKIRVLTAGRPKNKILRQEHKTRKSDKVDGKYASKAMKAYTGKNGPRKPSPAEARRTLHGRVKQSSRMSDRDAVAWLLENEWIKKPKTCPECGAKHLSDLVWPADRTCYWRCCSCENRCLLFGNSIFNGLRCGPAGLVDLLNSYCSLDANKCPNVVDMIQDSGFGRTTVEHFLSALRALEARAGLELQATMQLSGNIEVDGTFLSSFPISANNSHYYDQIWKIREKARTQKKTIPDKFLVETNLKFCLLSNTHHQKKT